MWVSIRTNQCVSGIKLNEDGHFTEFSRFSQRKLGKTFGLKNVVPQNIVLFSFWLI